MNANTLKYRKLWLTIGYGLIAVIVYFSLIASLPRTGLAHGDKLGHFLAYGSLMWWFCLLYPKTRRWTLAAIFIAMGFALDVSQSFVSRHVFDMLDVLANTIGIAVGWLLSKTPLSLTLMRIEQFLTQP